MESTNERASIKERAALISAGVTAALTIGKLILGLMTGSLAILAEAAHGVVDVAATLVTYYAVRLSEKPADAVHHYGHGKVESLAALAETAFLFLVSGVVVTEAVRRLLDGGAAVSVTPAAALFLVVVIAVDWWRVRRLTAVAKETQSQALEAGALHFASDMASSAVVLAGLMFVWLGFPQADAVAAILVAILICVMSFRLGRRTVDALMDAAPRGAQARLQAVVAGVPGVAAVEAVRLREVGSTLYAEIVVTVSRTLALERVAAIKQAIAQAAVEASAGVVATVTANPVALDDETILERVHVIARNDGLAIHHVTVQRLPGASGERLSVSLDLEVDGDMRLEAAHQVATGLERAVAQALGPDVEVETHIEPMQVDALVGEDCDAAIVAVMAGALSDLAADGPLGEVHQVRARQTARGVIVNLHCRAAGSIRVDDAHEAADDLERRFRAAFPQVARVISHVEPRGA